MMKNNLLLDTLHAVEQVEISFEQTLRMISEINHRYELVSTLKQRSADGQDSYEREIQAAITNRTFTKISSKKWKKKRVTPKKINKKRSTVSESSLQEELEELEECEEQEPPVTSPPEQISTPHMDIPYSTMCMQTNCQFYHIECKSNIVMPKRTYKERIERLHRAAHQKLSKQCQAYSNGCGNTETGSEQDKNCTCCCSYCCRSCCCNCCKSWCCCN